MEFPINVSSFREIIKGDYFFVDKTLMIKEIIKDGAKVIVPHSAKAFWKDAQSIDAIIYRDL